MAHLRGIPTLPARALRRAGRLLRRRRADEPARVRRHGHRLQLLPRRRSVRVRPRRLELGGRARAAARARRAPRGGGLLGRRPGVLRAAGRSRRSTTSSSTATATSSAATGWQAMVGEPVARAPELDFALGGRDFQGDTGRARLVGDVPFNVFARAISAARINLNITRRSHATVAGSSTVPAVRARRVRRRDRLEPARGDRALVRAGAASCSSSTTPTRRSRPTASCSTTRRRPRRWARARASACSTSTRTRTARGGCSRSSGSSAGGARVTEHAPRRDRPGLQRGGRDRAASSTRSAPSIPALDVVVVDDGSSDAHRRASPPRRGATVAAAAVQPRDRRRRADRLQVRARRTATTLAVRLDGDGQHDPPQLAEAARRRSTRGEADIVVGSRFVDADGGYRPPLARRVGIRCFARLVSLLDAAAASPTRPPGFQALEPRGHRALRRRLPARLSRGRGDA